MNVLILSAGTRNLIVRYFKAALGEGRVVTADADPLVPAGFESDAHYHVPPADAAAYPDRVLGICRQERIDGVLSLIDPEQNVLAAHAERFRRQGVTVIGSPLAQCELALNKLEMLRWLSAHGYRCARTWENLRGFSDACTAGEVDFPVFLKPVSGSASRGVLTASDMETVRCAFARRGDLLIQEYFEGQEIGADAYIDLISGKTVSVFTKKKLRMRAGETDRAVSFRDDRLFELIRRFAEEAGFRGPIDVDLFEVGDEYYISEVNPRIGGGYPLAHECGCDHVGMILENLRGAVNPRRIGCYEDGIYMMKYSEIVIAGDLPAADGTRLTEKRR